MGTRIKIRLILLLVADQRLITSQLRTPLLFEDKLTPPLSLLILMTIFTRNSEEEVSVVIGIPNNQFMIRPVLRCHR